MDSQSNLYLANGEEGGGRALDQGGHSNRVVEVPGRTVAVDAAGNIYTACGGYSPSYGVTVYNAQGHKGRSFGPDMMNPSSIAIDSKGNVAVATGFCVQVFDREGCCGVKGITGWLERDDGSTFTRPTAVTFDADDNLYVLDNSRRMQVFSPDVLAELLGQ